MIEEIQDDIIDQLQAIPGVLTVAAWQGEIEDLLKTPQKLPSLHVVYQGADFETFEQAGENTSAAMDFLIVLTAQNQKSRTAGSIASYALIEGVRGKLIGHQVAHYDFFRPVREDLITTRGGILVYGMVYQLKNVLIQTA